MVIRPGITKKTFVLFKKNAEMLRCILMHVDDTYVTYQNLKIKVMIFLIVMYCGAKK